MTRALGGSGPKTPDEEVTHEKETHTTKWWGVSDYFHSFWAEENKKKRNKWIGGILFAIAVILGLIVFYKVYNGWRPFSDKKQANSVFTMDTTSVYNPVIEEEPACRPRGSHRLCLPDTTRNAFVSWDDTIKVDTTSLPVKSTLCERSDTTLTSKVSCRPFEVHK